MKTFKKIICILTAASLLFSATACQTQSTVPTQSGDGDSEALAESVPDVSTGDQAAENSDTEGSDMIMVSSLEELRSELAAAEGSEQDPVVICITSDIEQDAKHPEEILTVEAGSHILLKASSEDISIRQTAGQSDAGTGVIIVNGSLTLEDITIDANGCGRGIFVERGAELTLNSKSCITGGTTSSRNVNAGLGVYVSAPLAQGDSYGNLTINEGASITGNTHAVSTYGRALGIGVYAGGAVTMNGGEITGNVDLTDPVSSEQRAAGGGVYCKSSVSSASAPWAAAGISNFIMNGGEISGNQAYAGAGIYCGDYSNVKLNSGLITENEAAYAGGAIAMDGLTGNTENLTRLKVTISRDISLSGNRARIGGAIYAGNGILDIDGSRITDNTAYSDEDEPQAQSTLCAVATSGGSGGAIYMAQAAVSLTDVLISGNSAISGVENADFPMGNGGAIYVTNATNYTFECSLNIYSGTITDNVAEGSGTYSGSGGGICAGFYPFEDKDPVVPTVNLYGGEITGNDAETGSDLAVMQEMSFKTRGYGGSTFGIGTQEGAPVVNIYENAVIGDTFPEDIEILSGGTENAPEGSDAIDSEDTISPDGTSETITLQGSLYQASDIPEGAARVSTEQELSDALTQASPFIVFTSDIGVKEPVMISCDTVIFGAGYTLYYDMEDFKETLINVSEGSVILDSIILKSGLSSRCLYVEKDASVSVSAAAFIGRRLIDQGLSVYNAGSLTLADTSISQAASATVNYLGIIYNRGNLAVKDGFTVDPESYVYTGTVYNEGTFDMEGGSFGGTGSNSNRNKYGSAVTNIGTFNMMGGTITGCKNSEAVFTGGEFNMSGGSISGNDTTCVSGITYNSVMSGGGVLVYGGTFNMYSGAEISDNTAYMGGGVGVYYSGSVFNMYGGTISGNRTQVYMTEESFNENNGCGGGVGIYGGSQFNMYGGEIRDNTAYIGDSVSESHMGAGRGTADSTGLGGGIYVLSGTVNIDGGTVTGNRALYAPYADEGGCGGGIYINDNGNENAIVNITAGLINGNYSDSGLGDDIFSGSQSEPVRDVICLYAGGSADIGKIYLGTNRTMLGIGSTIEGMTVGSLASNGRNSTGSAIARYTEGAVPDESDPLRLNFEGVSGLKLTDDKRELVIDLMDLADVTDITISDVTFTGKEIEPAALNAVLTVKDRWVIEAPGLSGFRAQDMTGNVNAGTGYVTLKGDNIRYSGTLENVPFNITPKSLDSEGLTLEFAEPGAIYVADGTTEFRPEVRISLDSQSTDSSPAYLEEGAEGDYTVTYIDNAVPGTAYAVLTATGNEGSNYTGSLMVPFEIYEKAALEAIILPEAAVDLPASAEGEVSEYMIVPQLIPEGAAGTGLVWESSDPDIAEVDENGRVRALSFGNAKVTVRSADGPDVSAELQVNVRFSDVTENGEEQYYYEPVYWAAEKGIITGIADNASFGVGEKCSKGDLLIMLWKMKGSPESEKYKDPETVFSDMAGYGPETELYKAAAWGYDSRIVIGSETQDGLCLFPDNWLSRGDMAVMMWRAAGRERAVGSMKFTDITEGGYKKNGDMYRAVMWFSKKSLAKGYKQSDGSYIFGLYYGVLREHAVTYLYRYAMTLDQ